MTFDVLIETALLGQGLADLTNAELLEIWASASSSALDKAGFVWLYQGELMVGCLESFLEYRKRADFLRLDSYRLQVLPRTELSGFCTAGAALCLARQFQARLVVTAGMGGICAGKISGDLPAINKKAAVLISSGFKDMIEASTTLAYLHAGNITVAGIEPVYNGFLFLRPAVGLDCRYGGESLEQLRARNCYLLFNGRKEDRRLGNDAWLQDSIEAGRAAQLTGNDFHPAVNKRLAYLSQGASSRLQFAALLENTALALEIAAKGKAV